MLINRDVKSTFNSKYMCDRCKTKLSKKDRNAIYVSKESSNLKKKWDLCPRCFRALCRGIAKGIKKEVDK